MDIEFTLLELLYIDDHLSPEMNGSVATSRPNFSADALGASKELITTFGRAFVELYETQNKERGPKRDKPIITSSTPVPLLEEDLWLIRDLAISTFMAGDEMVGLNLKYKIYAALRELDAGDVLEDFVINKSVESLSRDSIDSSLKEFIALNLEEENDDNSARED